MEKHIKLVSCFIEARKSTLFYLKCIDGNCSDDEINFFQTLATKSALQANEIQNLGIISDSYL